jgi:hypothetical protein
MVHSGFSISFPCSRAVCPRFAIGRPVLDKRRNPQAARIARVLLAVLVLSLIALPFVLRMEKDRAFISQLSAYVEETIDSSGLALDKTGLAAELVRRAINHHQLGIQRLYSLECSPAAGGLEACSPRKPEPLWPALGLSGKFPRLAAVKVPHKALWPSLSLWSFLFLALVLKARGFGFCWHGPGALRRLDLRIQGMGVLSFCCTNGRSRRSAAPFAFGVDRGLFKSGHQRRSFDWLARTGHYRGMDSIPQPKRSFHMK